MTSISDLPRELLHKIIPLTVEDSIAINDERSRRKILLNLALVSKQFTIPAQRLLWECMYFNDIVEVQDLIEEGFGKDKIIKKLRLMPIKSQTLMETQIDLDIAEKFLKGVFKIHEFCLIFPPGGASTDLKISNFFSIPSTNSIKSLIDVEHLEFTSENSTPPPALTSLECRFPEDYNDELIAIFKSSVNSLLSLTFITLSIELVYKPTFLPSFRLTAPNLTSLTMVATNNSVVEAILPFCTSLKSLELQHSSYDIHTIMHHLAILDPSVLLETFSLLWIHQPENFTSIIRILDSKPLKKVKYLYFFAVPVNEEDEEYDGYDLAEVLQEEEDFIEGCDERYIKLSVGTEEEEKIRDEMIRQSVFNWRQGMLDEALVNQS